MMRLTRIVAIWIGCASALAGLLVPPTLIRLLGEGSSDAACLEFPDTFGSWTAQQQLALPDDELDTLGAAGYWRRQYRGRATQQTVLATLVFGPAGRIAAHSPEICYARRAYQPVGPARTVRLAGTDSRFKMTSFRPRVAGQPALTVAYAWHDGQQWIAPTSPRLALAGVQQVCRLQVTCQHPDWATGEAEAALARFLQEALSGQTSSGAAPSAAGPQLDTSLAAIDPVAPTQQFTRRAP